ncbi:hypothetical protein MXL46_13855 [Heyndrickxia sporothermodurans]|nr:hypothetical protein [Heyndrickxia sporothermodurans]MBL5768437.1 hypothetical protein [Heyndrickxia sporothermodurans]MBL5772084.1 hypothetical protein [Heyndrickxia sporothermodurans]MBL5779339.1 hypothetical protein [Heyndrickxia sporothermodurans]MBL5783586.1 hypothetical protein [Heyndrickxia sporothermodurans]MBL5786328.1 hypothetical protein [Heyndrickxia sporothermodurans]
MNNYKTEIENVRKKIMSTNQAAKEWGYANKDSVKRLCREGKVASFKLDEQDPTSPYIILREQPNPKDK